MNDISICIPTYNRAGFLVQCLTHLSGFSDQRFEIVIGNNASTDETDEMVQPFLSTFRHIVYLRHDENIGFARNMDSILRRASRNYIYILNDDDFVFEQALMLAASLLRSNHAMVAVVGRYLSLRTLDPLLKMNYADAIASTIKKEAFPALLDNLSLCDGHPIIRRDTFQKNVLIWIELAPLFLSILICCSMVILLPSINHFFNTERQGRV